MAAYLLSITEKTQLESHPFKGALFESFVVSELLKQRFNRGQSDKNLPPSTEVYGSVRKSYLVYGGGETLRREAVQVMSWRDVGRLMT